MNEYFKKAIETYQEIIDFAKTLDKKHKDYAAVQVEALRAQASIDRINKHHQEHKNETTALS